MKLLQAVNRILGELGEHPVTSIENKNPSVSVILKSIEDANAELQVNGWWFNNYSTELYRGQDGTIQLPDGLIDWEWISHPSEARGSKLINTENMSEDWSLVGVKSVKGKVTLLIEFEDLPHSFAELVTARAGVMAYTNDAGMDEVVQLFMQREAQATSTVMSHHLRHRKYSTAKSGMFQRMHRHIWR